MLYSSFFFLHLFWIFTFDGSDVHVGLHPLTLFLIPSCFFCLQRWLDPQKPIKKQVKGKLSCNQCSLSLMLFAHQRTDLCSHINPIKAPSLLVYLTNFFFQPFWSLEGRLRLIHEQVRYWRIKCLDIPFKMEKCARLKFFSGCRE